MSQMIKKLNSGRLAIFHKAINGHLAVSMISHTRYVNSNQQKFALVSGRSFPGQ